MINTLNETHLHKTLKEIYLAQNEGSRSEVDISKEKSFASENAVTSKKYICDIVTKEGNVIEIQTGSLGHLMPKIMFLIALKKKVTVVYPLVTVKYIETYEKQKKPKAASKAKKASSKKASQLLAEEALSYGEFVTGTEQPSVSANTEETVLKSRRKSPSRKDIYSSLRELTALCPVLLSRYFYLEILEVTETEERLKQKTPVQSKNRRRRFRKDWIKQGKRLEAITQTHSFHGKKSWLSLLPKGLPEQFTVNDMCEAFAKQNVKIHKMDVSLLAWVYSRAGIFEMTGKKGNAHVYKIK